MNRKEKEKEKEKNRGKKKVPPLTKPPLVKIPTNEIHKFFPVTRL
jgi:hypothetical protein